MKTVVIMGDCCSDDPKPDGQHNKVMKEGDYLRLESLQYVTATWCNECFDSLYNFGLFVNF